jgi:hypothetical protein
MIMSTVLYGQPADFEAFERHNAGRRMGPVSDMPNVRQAETAVVREAPDGLRWPISRTSQPTVLVSEVD